MFYIRFILHVYVLTFGEKVSKPLTTVQDCVTTFVSHWILLQIFETFVSVTLLDIFVETPRRRPAVFVATQMIFFDRESGHLRPCLRLVITTLPVIWSWWIVIIGVIVTQDNQGWLEIAVQPTNVQSYGVFLIYFDLPKPVVMTEGPTETSENRCDVMCEYYWFQTKEQRGVIY